VNAQADSVRFISSRGLEGLSSTRVGPESSSLDAWCEWNEISRREDHVRMAADSTMLRMVKRLMALSLGVQRAQLEQRTGLTWPRPFLLRPLKKFH
jgi:hypothetical protein